MVEWGTKMFQYDYYCAHGVQCQRALVRRYNDGVKRFLDFTISLAASPAWVPLVAILWGITRLQGGAGFFAHTRIGHNGVAFKCWKICTMVPGAEHQLQKHLIANAAAAEEWRIFRKLSTLLKSLIGQYSHRSYRLSGLHLSLVKNKLNRPQFA